MQIDETDDTNIHMLYLQITCTHICTQNLFLMWAQDFIYVYLCGNTDTEKRASIIRSLKQKQKKLKYIKSQTAVPQIPPARTMMGFWCQDSLPGFQLHFAKQNFIEILHPSELDCKGKTR